MRIDAEPERLRGLVGPQIFNEGRSGWEQGQIEWMTWDRPSLWAEVKNPVGPSYRVHLELVQEEDVWRPAVAMCSCADASSPWCSHSVAVLLAAEHASVELLRERPFAWRINGLSEETSRQWLLELLSVDEATFVIARQLCKLQQDASFSPLDLPGLLQAMVILVRRATETVRAGSDDPNTVSDDDGFDELNDFLDAISDLVDNRRNVEAMTLLTELTQRVVDAWEVLVNSDESAYMFVNDLTEVWLEAVLSEPLSSEKREKLLASVKEWHECFANYGNASMAALLLALKYGPDWTAMEQDPEFFHLDYRMMVATAWLFCLDRDGDDFGYLQYSEAAGLHLLHALRLISVHRLSDAKSYASQHVRDELELRMMVLVMARINLEEAFQFGLERWNELVEAPMLASVLAEWAETLNQTESLLSLHQSAWPSDPSIERYRRLKELSKDRWAEISPDLLAVYKSGVHPDDGVTVLIAEGQFDDMIALIEKTPMINDATLKQAAEAAISERPQWVIEFFSKRAMEIMDAGRHEEYERAAEYASYARDGYLKLNQAKNWNRWKAWVLARHKRKDTLTPLIRSL
jgi:hypothetical protein